MAALLRGGTIGHVKDTKVWIREEYRRLENESFSTFVDNLPEDISKRELFQLFSWTGCINDIYLSRKQKNGGIYIFVFIRYTTKGGALKATTEMNRMRLRGKVIFVGKAKYKRSSEVKDTSKIHHRGDTRNVMARQMLQEREETQKISAISNKYLTKEKTVQDPHGNGWTKKVEVVVTKENFV
ncbi:sex-lethal homolog [Arachis ipaensis]|uniref:sex-lethal homolog n=1 Tax=Arachis ipaensis TaxID=130454 RepID=UPI0007AEF0D9|nr:sex-lethal homolog [Arachis ipaensis]XP_016207237.1 sex-lethal homolog [Arachis ipaensis]XP_025684754.1 sex-lethal homolog [Arachis hypogaea]